MIMRRRRQRRAPELTPLIDVLFILLFASLIQARSAVKESRAQRAEDPIVATAADESTDAGPVDAGPADAGPVDAGPLDARTGDAGPVDASAPAPEPEHLLRSRSLATTMVQSVRERSSFVVEIRSDGYVTSIARWLDGQEMTRERAAHRLIVPVLPHQSDAELSYLGTGHAGRLCPWIRSRADAQADTDLLIFVILDVPIDDLPLALSRGLKEDLSDCFDIARGVVIFVQPQGQSHGFP